MTSGEVEENNVCLWGRYGATTPVLDKSSNTLIPGVG